MAQDQKGELVIMPNQLRRTLEGLFLREARDKQVLVGIHWPQKAAVEGEGNLTTVAGEWRANESQAFAMARLAQSEYGLTDGSITVTPLNHPRFISEHAMKEYHWAVVKYDGDVVPNHQHVASFGWYAGPDALRTAVNQMRFEKGRMFVQVLGLAIAIEPRLVRYHRAVSDLVLAG